jgi:hypothetical protein
LTPARRPFDGIFPERRAGSSNPTNEDPVARRADKLDACGLAATCMVITR